MSGKEVFPAEERVLTHHLGLVKGEFHIISYEKALKFHGLKQVR
jgi:hypothetical protein